MSDDAKSPETSDAENDSATDAKKDEKNDADSDGQNADGQSADDKKVDSKKDAAASEAAPKEKSSFLGSAKFILAFIATLGIGYFVGQQIQEWRRPAVDLETGDRYKVALRGDEPQMGPDDALVTIIEYSDFQCPYCGRAAPPLKEAIEDFDGDARLIFKHYPLPNHSKAAPAAYVSWAAHQQGKFWEVHDRLFEAKADITGVPDWVQELELDGARLGEDMESDEARTQVDDDHLSGGRVGIGGTPSFVVNGHFYSGFKPTSDWKQIIKAELEIAQALVDDGTARAEVYAKLMENANETRGGGGGGVGGTPSDRPKQARRPGEPDPAAHYAVPAGVGRPQLGPDDALVTIVEFADFHCPYCGKVGATVKKVQAAHPEDVRVIFRQRPLSMHAKARPASKAALAAHRQGKFWEMHDKLFAKKVGELEQFKEVAEELGLDLAKFETDYADAALETMIQEDESIASQFGSRGTPAFFVNGRFISGAQPFSAFDALVTEELEVAKRRVEGGIAAADYYATLVSESKTRVED